MLPPEFEGFAAVAGVADQRHVGLITLNHGDQPSPHNAMIIGDKDPDASLWPARARGVSPGSSHDGGMAPFPAGIHNTSSGFKGNSAVTIVPLRRELTIFNSPPISSARSRIPVRPIPSCRSVTWNPLPSSRSSRRSCFALETKRVRKFLAWAYFRGLLKASWPMRNKFCCHAGGSNGTLRLVSKGG